MSDSGDPEAVTEIGDRPYLLKARVIIASDTSPHDQVKGRQLRPDRRHDLLYAVFLIGSDLVQ